jgi:RNA polymerase sigma-70 factor (ECF subfamily)
MTFEAIARALDLSPNTVASRYRYGLDKMRQQLRPLYDEAMR